LDRILTTHAGSLARPPELLAFLVAMEHGDGYDPDAHGEVLREAVADIVRRQAEIGIDFVDDGEMGKSSWITYLYERISGLEPRLIPAERGNTLPPSRDRLAFPEFYAEHDEAIAKESRHRIRLAGAEAEQSASEPAGDVEAQGKIWVCTGPITYNGEALQRDIANLKTALEGRQVEGAFMPVVAPASVYWLENEYYGTEEEFVFAVADALHEEYKGIVDAGFLLQVDDAVLVHECDSIMSLGGSFEDYRRWAKVRIEALNHALSGIPEERIRYHVCFGSWHGPHVYDPPLVDVVDLVLEVNAGAYSIEQANPRHEHEWRVWEDVKLPEGKALIPGVVTHHTTVVEHPQLVADRIVRLAKIVGRDNVIGGTDCGFAQGAFIQRVHPSVQWAKLEALVEGAKLATRELWGS
jgi:5-methyltetrahydropteroyltriglutamate--homocysteine methyltransferase